MADINQNLKRANDGPVGQHLDANEQLVITGENNPHPTKDKDSHSRLDALEASNQQILSKLDAVGINNFPVTQQVEGNVQLTGSTAQVDTMIVGGKYEHEVIDLSPTTTNQQEIIEHAQLGLIEQTMILENTLDTAVNMYIKIGYNQPSGRSGPHIWGATSDYNVPSGAKFVFTPERGAYVIDNANEKVIELLELRQPHWYFRINYSTETTPTTGNLKLILVRRF